MNIISIIEEIISKHNYQKIIPNNYEQGNNYVGQVSDNIPNNRFIPYTRNNYTTINREKKKPYETTNNTLALKSVFEKILFLYENGAILDFDQYKIHFYNSLSDDVFKSISKRHQVLKKDVYTFVNDNEFGYPKNKDVLKLFSTILNVNIVICINEKQYISHKNDNHDKTILILNSDKSKFLEERIYSTYEEMLHDILLHKYTEYKNIADMKVHELREYVKDLDINITACKTKKDIVETVTKAYAK